MSEERWIASQWPKLVIAAGVVVFWLTGWYGERLPVTTMLIGPAIMLAGIAIKVWRHPGAAGNRTR